MSDMDEETTKKEGLKVAILSLSGEKSVQGLFHKFNQLQEASSVVQGNISFVKLDPPDLDNKNYAPGEIVDVVILLHSVLEGRFSLTDVMDARYDNLLPSLERKFGPNRVAVIAHSLPNFSEDTKDVRMMMIQNSQSTTFRCSNCVILCGRLEEMADIEWKKLLLFIKQSSDHHMSTASLSTSSSIVKDEIIISPPTITSSTETADEGNAVAPMSENNAGDLSPTTSSTSRKDEIISSHPTAPSTAEKIDVDSCPNEICSQDSSPTRDHVAPSDRYQRTEPVEMQTEISQGVSVPHEAERDKQETSAHSSSTTIAASAKTNANDSSTAYPKQQGPRYPILEQNVPEQRFGVKSPFRTILKKMSSFTNSSRSSAQYPTQTRAEGNVVLIALVTTPDSKNTIMMKDALLRHLGPITIVDGPLDSFTNSWHMFTAAIYDVEARDPSFDYFVRDIAEDKRIQNFAAVLSCADSPYLPPRRSHIFGTRLFTYQAPPGGHAILFDQQTVEGMRSFFRLCGRRFKEENMFQSCQLM